MFCVAPNHIQCNADVAQLVAHHLAKVRVASSSLVIRSTFPFWVQQIQDSEKLASAFSSAGERFPDTEEVTGSIPVSRTNQRVLSLGECGCSAVGSASPCQGEGREFESRHPLHSFSPRVNYIGSRASFISWLLLTQGLFATPLKSCPAPFISTCGLATSPVSGVPPSHSPHSRLGSINDEAASDPFD